MKSTSLSTLVPKCMVAVCALMLASPAWALQNLCQNSPENPTLILGLLSVAAAGYPMVREHVAGYLRRKSRNPHSNDAE